MFSRDPLVVDLVVVECSLRSYVISECMYSPTHLEGPSVAGTSLGGGATVGPIAGVGVQSVLVNRGVLAKGKGICAGLVMRDRVQQRCLGLLLKKEFLSF